MTANNQREACDLSVIVPAFNEEQRLPETLDKMQQYLDANYTEYEVLVVDDGSQDKTSQVVLDMQQGFPQLHLIERDKNYGKGAAVRHGLEQAVGKLRLFSDADLSTPMHCLKTLESAITRGADVAIGSRAHTDTVIPQSQAFPRQGMGQVFNMLMRQLVGLPFADTQCGFKLFTAQAVDKILPHARIDGFAFDVELLVIAKSMGLKVVDCPIEWSNDASSRVNVLIHPAAMLKELIKIRKNIQNGNYL